MAESMKKKDLTGKMKELKRAHPTLQDRLTVYRDRREAYDAKRLSHPAPAVTPAEQGARYEPRG